jgi:hypothetical protein
MRIFLSYASEDRDVAALVKESLAARGHRVFFDRDSLPPGESYEDQIEAAIGASGLLVFLISPDSVAQGRFTRTELNFAEKKWGRARNRVLPVMIRKTPMDQVPPFLRAVSILEPEGNLPAETAAAAQRLARRTLRIATPIALAVAATFVAGAAYLVLQPPGVRLAIESRGPQARGRAMFDKEATVFLPYLVTNLSAKSVTISQVTLEGPDGSVLSRQLAEANELGAVDFDLAPSAGVERGFTIQASSLSAAGAWRICAYPDDAPKACADPASRDVSGSAYGENGFAIPTEIARQAVAIAWGGSNFLVLTQSPNRLWTLAEDGQAKPVLDLAAPPISISSTPLGLYVGLGGKANTVIRLDPATYAILGSREITFPAELKGTFGEPLSRTPVNLADDGRLLWVRTAGEAGASGLAYLPADLGTLATPPWFEDNSFEVSDMALRSGAGAVWSARTNTTPSSLYRLTAEKLDIFDGHDFDSVSCASDVLPAASILTAVGADAPDDADVLFPGCEGDVRSVKAGADGVQALPDYGVLIGYRPSPTLWPSALMGKTVDRRLIVGVTSRHGRAPEGPFTYGVSIDAYGVSGGATNFFLEEEGVQLVALAGGAKTALALVENDHGERELVAPPLP